MPGCSHARLAGVLDERWIRSLHVETMHEGELHGEHEHHVLFQASTVGALLDGAYEGVSASPSWPSTATSASAR
jgi:hypothetical protein